MQEVLTQVQGNVLVITLNRPESMNAINSALTAGLTAAIEKLDSDPDLAVGVLLGNGRGFCSGMDLNAFATEGLPVGFDRLIQEGSTKPLVAGVEGFALAGGLELLLICDLIVCATGVKLGIPEVKVGLFAAGGGILRLQRRLPYAVAMEMALTGAPIDAERAHALGLVSTVTPSGEAAKAAMELAGKVAANAPLATATSKTLINRAAGLTETEFWALQAPHVPRVFKSNDAKEGPRAFAQKRPPQWTGS